MQTNSNGGAWLGDANSRFTEGVTCAKALGPRSLHGNQSSMSGSTGDGHVSSEDSEGSPVPGHEAP